MLRDYTSGRVYVVPRSAVSAEATAYLAERFAVIEHQFDCGPLRVWQSAGYFPNLFVVFDVASDMPIGALYRAGLPDSIDAAWWIDSLYRGRGYGVEMIDAFVLMLKSEGVTKIGPIRVDTYNDEYDIASRCLVDRLKAHF